MDTLGKYKLSVTGNCPEFFFEENTVGEAPTVLFYYIIEKNNKQERHQVPHLYVQEKQNLS
jgi:hypothetical protein